jgi:hypothetical protein
MPALFPLRLSLTKEQNEWLEGRGDKDGKTDAQVVSSLIDAEMRGENTAARLAELSRLLTESEARRRRLEEVLVSNTSAAMILLKELFRESSANLYRINQIVSQFDDPASERQLLNEFVRGKEREMEAALSRLTGRDTDR